jgi:hypothetical protein
MFVFQLDLYTRFKAAHPHVKVSFVSFRRLRPFFIMRLKDFNSCCCIYHQQMAEITIGFNNMRASKVHLVEGEQYCNCWCSGLCCNSVCGRAVAGPVSCQHLQHRYKRSSYLWEQSLCPKAAGSAWHSLACLKNECEDCGFQRLPICDRELDPENQTQMAWR